MSLFVQETYINRTAGHQIGETDVMDAYADTLGELYRASQADYGRCIGKIYRDGPDGPVATGWVFVGRDTYQRSDETYLREVWVTVHTAEPTRTVQYHYAEL
jgi:hypothetical protein